ncbi:MAG: DNA repair protein RadC [Chlamydiota bacterium]
MEKAAQPHYAGHRARLRERLVRTRGEGLHDYEALELLLAHAIPRRDVKPLAKDLLARFGGLAEVFDAETAELESVAGMGPAAASLILLVKTIFVACSAAGMKGMDLLSSPGAAVEFARVKLAGLSREQFMVIFLNAKNEIIAHEIVNTGTVDRAAVYPRTIVEAALARHAVGLILVHNHPSGHPEPSAEDRAITRAIADACRTVDVRILDHLVIGRAGHFSFAEENML